MCAAELPAVRAVAVEPIAKRPAGLASVMSPTERRSVRRAGFTLLAVGHDVVDVAVVPGLVAAGKGADLSSGDGQINQGLRWPVGRAPVVENLTRHRIGDHPAPGRVRSKGKATEFLGRDRPVTVQVPGLVVQACDGAERGMKVDPGLAALCLG
ncbi:MAG: hypothetical protein QOD87_2423 [Pseudonocardiales bacterium]|nr:hypothetical protein [Pseudonocardiales bacterium]